MRHPFQLLFWQERESMQCPGSSTTPAQDSVGEFESQARFE